MLSESKLDEMLAQWRREYGPGGGPGGGGVNILQILIDHKGEPPRGGGWGARMARAGTRTLGDEVEDAIRQMLNIRTETAPNQYYRAAMVLRVEHLTPHHWPESERLVKLRKIGLEMSRHTYYRAIQFGRAYLMGALSKKEVA